MPCSDGGVVRSPEGPDGPPADADLRETPRCRLPYPRAAPPARDFGQICGGHQLGGLWNCPIASFIGLTNCAAARCAGLMSGEADATSLRCHLALPAPPQPNSPPPTHP